MFTFNARICSMPPTTEHAKARRDQRSFGSSSGLRVSAGERGRSRPRRRVARSFIAPFVVALSSFAALKGATAEPPTQQYWVDVMLFSFNPDAGIDTHRSHGGGGGSGRATLGTGVATNNRRFHVSVKIQRKSQRLLAKVIVEPKKGDDLTKAQEIDLDLSDLSARFLDVARDEDGRIYRLNLTPSIREVPQPRTFRVDDLRLDCFSFSTSLVILNDDHYVGRLDLHHGSFAHIEIPGHALIEFSLLHLKDAEPLGVLQNGIIDIKHSDGTTLRITNVKHGIYPTILPGGPWQVWVRWKKPTRTLPEYRELLRQQLSILKERVTNGEMTISPERLRQLERRSQTGDYIGLMSCGVGPVRPDEIVQE